MLADVLHHAVRHQIPDRLVVFGAAAYIRSKRWPRPGLKRIDLSFGQGRTPSGILEQPGRVTATKWARSHMRSASFPLHNFGHGVCAGDEEQLGVGMLSADIAQGVDGVGDARTVDVSTQTVNLGSDAVDDGASMPISALVTCLSSLNTGGPVGTKIRLPSRYVPQATSEAATKWPV